MSKKLSRLQIGGFLFTSVFGSLLHYLYDWSGRSTVAALFSAVNESIWEHMKLLFVPLFIYALIEYRFMKDVNDYWTVKLIGTLLGLSLIPIIYYTYNGAIGKSPDWLNIAIFFISAAAVFLLEYMQFKSKKAYSISPRISFMLLCVIGLMFLVFTFLTPRLPIFADPIYNSYGI